MSTAITHREDPAIAAPQDDRFTFGLVLDVAEVLERHGYPEVTGVELVELRTALFRLLHAESG